MHTNRLAKEKSPYLLQHAHNPVDWYPWGEEAFEKARLEHKPIFLSIGYSTCHWCHVMERESFESESVAELLNANFISIKVDREERPDVDAVYMSALQGMTGSGGWPMSLFLAPDLKPFFAGTYFPPVPAHGRPSFTQLIERIHELWTTERETLLESAAGITRALQNPKNNDRSPSPNLQNVIETTFQYFQQSFDPAEGGFGGAPKFPRPVQFDFLFNYFAASGDTQARDMALFTLRKMALGGMHDHIGGGFHRYSVDRYWRISHFEKMLYDQAQLVHSYLDAWQVTHDPFFRDVVSDILEYILRAMTHPEGAFFSAEDADSEGEEGKFYVWTLAQIEEALGPDAGNFANYYGITRGGNFEHGNNVLYVTELSHPAHKSFAALREKLFAIRKKRIRPLPDDKILTSWNGLMIGAIARAGDILNEPRYINAATNAGQFIWQNLRQGSNLLHRWRDGEARFDAYLDDYAFLIKGYLDLYEATFDAVWIERAIELQAEQDRILFDEKQGGYFNARESEDLILRSKNEYDGAEPSGNSIAAMNLFRLANLTGDDRFKSRAEEILRTFIAKIGNYPYSMPAMMSSAFWLQNGVVQIVLAGNDTSEFRQVLNSYYMPLSVKVRAENSPNAFTGSLQAVEGKTTVYLCRNFVCELPITEPKDLEKLLSDNPAG